MNGNKGMRNPSETYLRTGPTCFSLGIFLTILVALFTSAHAEPLRLLESPDAWQRVGGSEGSFRFDDGSLILDRGEQAPSAMLTKDEYENFDLRFEFKYHRWAESGLFIHAPWNGAYRTGLEIELADDTGKEPDIYRSGAVYRVVPPKVVAVKKDGEWNTCDVHMDWPRLFVRINDIVVQDLDLGAHPELRYTLRRGAIGFQNNHGWGVHIRAFELTPLPDSAPEIRMLDHGLDDWQEVRPKNATWTFEGDETLVFRGGYGYMQYQRDVQDFMLRLYYRTTAAANGGVFFRWLADDSDRGNEIQILDLPGTTMPSGSIYDIARANDLLITPGEWTLLQVYVRGSEAITWINGVKAAETTELTKIRPGRITLQAHRDDCTIEFKDMVLLPLD